LGAKRLKLTQLIQSTLTVGRLRIKSVDTAKHVVPTAELESNPEVWNQMLEKLGVSSEWQFQDVYGLDDELLAMVPQDEVPPIALVILYPDGALGKEDAKQQEQSESESSALFIKQLPGLHNACGTLAALHSVINNTDQIKLSDDSVLGSFVKQVSSLKDSEARGQALADHAQIEQIHSSLAVLGQTAALSAEDEKNVSNHFVCITRVGDALVELDGIKARPVAHGATSPAAFLRDAAQVLKQQYVQKLGEDAQMALMALCFVKNE